MDKLPDELKNIIREYQIFKPKSKKELQEAVDLWCENKEDALFKYLHISSWNTSLITDMKNLFSGKIKGFEVNEESAFDLDTKFQLKILKKLI